MCLHRIEGPLPKVGGDTGTIDDMAQLLLENLRIASIRCKAAEPQAVKGFYNMTANKAFCADDRNLWGG
ncbi:hypothetical protein D3C86_2124860 [compost metagenome]